MRELSQTAMAKKMRAWRAANPEKDKASKRAWDLKNPGRSVAASKAWQARNPKRVSANHRLWNYGLTQEGFDALVAQQRGLCPVCTKPLGRKLCVDHDHVTNVVRGIIHQGCNVGIGLLGDTLAGVTRAVEYLRRTPVTSIRYVANQAVCLN